ncbi:MAG TPA: general secretion pathway protein GspB [Gammaproteobacteria bacterium]|nr:general secretion pathway protein GspB [Gammaproteobacteria bacterium]
MSLLLDALRRSEHERQQTLKTRLGRSGPAPAPVRPRAPWAWAIALLVCVNLGLIALWTTRSKPAAPPPDKPASVSVPAQQPVVRSLAQEATLDVPPAATTSAPQRTIAAKTESAPPAGDDAQPLDTLPQSVQQDLPELRMQVHVYSADPAKRFVMFDMKRYREGDTLASGPKIIRITREGVVLQYQGRTFLLPNRQ